MMKLNAKVAAHVFFDVHVSGRDMPKAIGSIFCWTDDGSGPTGKQGQDGTDPRVLRRSGESAEAAMARLRSHRNIQRR